MEWKAIYKDGSVLNQYNKDQSENKYGDIKRSKLVRFELVKHNQVVATIHLDSKKQLIYRRRVAMHVTGPNAGLQEAVYLVGWQENRNGVNMQALCFVFEDGHFELLDRFREKHPWFYSVKFKKEEKLKEVKKT